MRCVYEFAQYDDQWRPARMSNDPLTRRRWPVSSSCGQKCDQQAILATANENCWCRTGSPDWPIKTNAERADGPIARFKYLNTKRYFWITNQPLTCNESRRKSRIELRCRRERATLKTNDWQHLPGQLGSRMVRIVTGGGGERQIVDGARLHSERLCEVSVEAAQARVAQLCINFGICFISSFT